VTRAKQQAAPHVSETTTDHRKQMARLIEQLAHRHSAWNVFSDFVEVSAISISNAVDLAQRTDREARYHEIVKRYTTDEFALFPQMFNELVLALETGFDDVLGRLFHDLELHNKWTGQFFSPYSLAQGMARMTIGGRDEIERAMAAKGYLTALEPASGGGAMMIALAEAMKAEGVNYQQALHVTAVDVDLKCVHMTYLQLALLGVPAIVVHGNSLSLEERSRWRTPMHMMGGWTWRLGRDRTAARAPAVVERTSTEVEPAVASAVATDFQFHLGLEGAA
jgi:hypothetical protein